MNIDTDAIRRLRDHLLAHFEQSGSVADVQSVSARSEALLRRVSPFAETMYLVMVADGEPAEVERRALLAAIDVLTDGALASTEIESMVERFERSNDQGRTEARLEQIGSRICVDRDDRETAFSLGAVVALADEAVNVNENRALEWIRQYYGISDRQAGEILESL